jgi:hypothetical protein
MDSSRLPAAIIGPVADALAVSLFVNPNLVAELAASVAADPPLVLLSGVLIMVAGLAILRGEGRFGSVKLAGWLFVLGGIARIVMVRQMAELTGLVGQVPQASLIAGVAVGLVGLYFTWLGWFAKPRAEAPTAYES